MRDLLVSVVVNNVRNIQVITILIDNRRSHKVPTAPGRVYRHKYPVRVDPVRQYPVVIPQVVWIEYGTVPFYRLTHELC